MKKHRRLRILLALAVFSLMVPAFVFGQAPQSPVGWLTATQFPGSDIGAQVNAAIAALPLQNGNHSGTVFIPAASSAYLWNTTIKLPSGVSLIGASQGGSALQWTPRAGAAIICGSPDHYSQGLIQDLVLAGSFGTSIGIYFGGVPSGMVSPPITYAHGNPVPAGNPQGMDTPSAYHYFWASIVRVRIATFGVGVEFGNHAAFFNFTDTVIIRNGTGVYYPSGTTDSGESMSFIHTTINNNSVQGIDLVAYGDFFFTDCSLDYNGPAMNGPAGTITGAAQASFYGSHFEQSSGSFFALNAPTDTRARLFISGGSMLVTASTGTTPYFINVPSGNIGTLDVADLWVYNTRGQSVTSFVNWASAGGQLSLTNLQVPVPFAARHLIAGTPPANTTPLVQSTRLTGGATTFTYPLAYSSIPACVCAGEGGNCNVASVSTTACVLNESVSTNDVIVSGAP
jgi:hypothetical protein